MREFSYIIITNWIFLHKEAEKLEILKKNQYPKYEKVALITKLLGRLSAPCPDWLTSQKWRQRFKLTSVNENSKYEVIIYDKN